MVKNKALPDSARPCKHPRLVILSLSLSLSFSLSASQTWPYQGWSHVSSLSLSFADAIHPEGIPWILLRLDPGKSLKVLFFYLMPLLTLHLSLP